MKHRDVLKIRTGRNKNRSPKEQEGIDGVYEERHFTGRCTCQQNLKQWKVVDAEMLIGSLGMGVSMQNCSRPSNSMTFPTWYTPEVCP